MKNMLSVALAIALAVSGISWAQPPAEKLESNQAQGDKAVDRTRRQVKMLDDIYKGGIVLITTNYVNGDEDLPAGTAFKKLFEAAKEKGLARSQAG